MKIAKILLRGAVRQTDNYYSYLIPPEMEPAVSEGYLVRVPFGNSNKRMAGVIMEICDDTTLSGVNMSRIKRIDSVVDEGPALTEEQMKLIEPLARRYNCTRSDVLELFVPAFVEGHKARTCAYLDIADREKAIDLLVTNKLRSINHIKVLEYLLEYGRTDKKTVCSDTGAPPACIKALVDRGVICVTTDKAPDESSYEDTVVPEDSKYTSEYDLNDSQRAAVRAVTEIPQDGDRFKVFLLYGVTGSGKTEVFLNCASSVLSRGGQVLYLVPEIALTPQTEMWIKGRLGDGCAVLHSKLTDNQRYEQWDKIRSGKANVVVGPRSAVFAPLRNLKLVIIDEEHDPSYKAESHPRYNAKTIAMMRARYHDARVVMGSATPAVESFYAAEQGYYTLLRLPSRAKAGAVLPKVYPIDMREQIKLGGGDLISIPLRSAMARAFAQDKQVILFLNRRGYSRTLVCNECGETAKCIHCSVGMTLHNNPRSGDRLLICHYCGYTVPVSEAVCDTCGGHKFTRAGYGTQQLEEALNKLYPDRKVLRMDQDTTQRRGAVSDIVSAFAAGEASILIGTQMIAKGHDFPNCTVVGILSADLMINSSNVRGSERAFALITQASGRAGRGDVPGEVYIQTQNPEDPLFINAASQDYEAFYRNEIAFRENLKLPPFKAMGEIILALPDANEAYQKASALMKYISDFLAIQDPSYEFECFGPIPDVIFELREKFRYSITIKARNISAINSVFRQIMEDFDYREYPLSFDNDCI
ncbi:replication restart DNA helicase PriA [Ruminococcaceae bacterium YRB3002]|nr:replication restart DNA helicase PriA [Ruminococcaceae bacterium YRB3002]